MKTTSFLIGCCLLGSTAARATVHNIGVWDGYYQFVPNNKTITLGDTIQWTPWFGLPTMAHTITSTTIPAGAAPFDKLFDVPADTFFQYVPQVAGMYNYECTPHVTMNMVASFEVLPASLGTGTHSAENTLAVFPNPAAEWIFLREPERYQAFRLLDASSREILSGKPGNRIDLRQLPAGLYVLSLYGDRPKSVRVVKE